MLHQICTLLEKPPLYQKMDREFWNDPYISKQMLDAHLNPDFEGASRKLDFIEKSVNWISRTVSPLRYTELLDIGCGPGIYAERFCKAGYQVTGIDFSERSIGFARESARQQGMEISYRYENYLSMNLDKCFDFCTMIYCDYGALSANDRQILMHKVYKHLKPKGKFLLDVFSMEEYRAFQEGRTWEIREGGFWRAEKYAEFCGRYKYSDNVTLEQTAVISDHDTAVYYLWNTCFTQELLRKEAQAAGFKVCDFWGDVAGSAYTKDSQTIAVLLEKEQQAVC